MLEMNDMALICEYADGGSEPAFAELVRRHIHFVYSVAFRYVGNPADTLDVTQAVFIILTKKAGSLRQRSTLTGWLYETTRLTAATFLRSRARQQIREQKAYMESTMNDSDPDGVWRQIAPFLEEAMNSLQEKERTLLALRFFENKTAAETAALLGIREGAAHKRAVRALEKVRRFFFKRGIHSTTATIAGAISANSIQAAPVALAKSITAVAMTKGFAASGSTLTLVQGTLKIMTWTKLKTVAVSGVIALLLAGTAALVIQRVNAQTNVVKASSPVSTNAPDGFATPEAALKSFIWSEGTGNPDQLLAACTPEQAARMREKMAGKTDDELKPLLIQEAKNRSNYEITEKEVMSEDEVRLHLEVQPYPGHPRVGNDVQVMQKIDHAWKYAGKYGVDIKEN